MWRGVLRREEVQMHDFSDGWAFAGTGSVKKNPDYRADLVLNLHRDNMRTLMRKLGYLNGGDGMAIPIDEFRAVAEKWLSTSTVRSKPVIELRDCDDAMDDNWKIEAGLVREVVEKALSIAKEGQRRGASYLSIG